MPCSTQELQPCITTLTGIPSHQRGWDRNSLLTTETVLMRGTEQRSLAPISAYEAVYIKKSCWAKPKTTSGNRPELRTHLIPKECPCHSASDTAWRMTNLALGSYPSPYTMAGSARGSEWAWPIFRLGLPWETSATGLKPGFPDDRPSAPSSRPTALKALFRNQIFCNRPVKTHYLFAHHSAQNPQGDAEASKSTLETQNSKIWDHWTRLQMWR